MQEKYTNETKPGNKELVAVNQAKTDEIQTQYLQSR